MPIADPFGDLFGPVEALTAVPLQAPRVEAAPVEAAAKVAQESAEVARTAAEVALSQIPASEPTQVALFDKGEWHDEHWKGMPEFVQLNQMPWKTLKVHFENRADMMAFAKLVGQTIGLNTRYIWYPESELLAAAHLRYADAEEATEEVETESEDIEVLDQQ